MQNQNEPNACPQCGGGPVTWKCTCEPMWRPTAVVLDERAAFESALFELVNKIDTGLDTGDLLKDAKRASAALDSILSGGDLVACAHEYFCDSGDRYEKSIEFRIGWNACLDAIAQARTAYTQVTKEPK